LKKEKIMIRHTLIAGILTALFAAASVAADIDGRWQGSFSGPNGDIQIAFNFKVDGAKLTGSVDTPNGSVPIDEGKVEGDHISFKTHFDNNEVNHEGTVSGDTIQLTVEGPWGKSEMTLKRAQEKKTSFRLAWSGQAARVA
jgi:hypothetical protein